MLNKQKGNMYGFVTHTFNTVKGRCPHGCSYCYMQRFGKQPDLHFDKAELKTDLGENNFIFVGSSCDMWAEDIRSAWILQTLGHCRDFPENKYLFQSKNPEKFQYFVCVLFPENSVIATTIETNRPYPEMGSAPPIEKRLIAMRQIKEKGFRTMITIEPIMDFDFMDLVNWIYEARPDSVNIGADSQGHGLPEPSAEKIKKLLVELSKFTKILPKPNLKRLLGR